MRLYVVGVENFPKLCDALRKRDLPVQVITDARKTGEIACGERPGAVLCYLPAYSGKKKQKQRLYRQDCRLLLRIWNKDGRYSLVRIGGILNLDGVHSLLAVPEVLCGEECVRQLVSQLKGRV